MGMLRGVRFYRPDSLFAFDHQSIWEEAIQSTVHVHTYPGGSCASERALSFPRVNLLKPQRALCHASKLPKLIPAHVSISFSANQSINPRATPTIKLVHLCICAPIHHCISAPTHICMARAIPTPPFFHLLTVYVSRPSQRDAARPKRT